VNVFLVVQSATGLWLYLAPFSVAAQVQLLVHLGLGLLVTLPCLYYLVRHVFVWYAQTPTVVMVLGYLLMLMVLACLVSGLFVTWHGAVGPKLSELWET
jgi:hypothetical protein